MRNQTFVQVEGLGVPVQVPTNRTAQGYEIRWSSDPQAPIDARVHLLNSERELTNFLKLAVDPRFLKADLLKMMPVRIDDDRKSLTRAEAEKAGADPDCWNLVRVALVISGTSPRGPAIDEIEWVGTRDEHQEGVHLREAYEHARNRNISHPVFFLHNESGPIQRAADFMAEFNRQMNPALRAAETLNQAHQEAVINMDIDNLNGDRAIHYLRQFQESLINLKTVKALTIQNSFSNAQQAAPRPEAPATEQPEPTPQNSSGPRFH